MGVAAIEGHPAHLDVRLTGLKEPAVASLPRALDANPALRSVSIVSGHALDPVGNAMVATLSRHCRERGREFSVDFVLDAGADAFAALGRQPTSLAAMLEQSKAWRIRGVTVRWWFPLLPALVWRLEALFSLARDERIDVVLVPPEQAPIGIGTSVEHLDAEHRRFVHDFIGVRLLGEDLRLLSPDRVRFYESLRDAMASPVAVLPEASSATAVMEVDDHGQWMIQRYAGPPSAMRGAGPPHAGSPARAPAASPPESRATEVMGVLAEGGRAAAQWARTVLTPAARRSPHDGARVLPRVLVIGAYGGDHIGDTAILGGVLLRVHRRHQTQHAILVSQRPAHSARLVAMLDIPVSVRVEGYTQSTVASLVAEVDGVVFAGGPLMDLPKQLVKHLYTVALARREGKPFLVEGIGAGPFIRRVSAWTARRLVRMAARITVRTTADSHAPLVRGLDPIVGRDPAFDYLETRGRVLTRLRQEDQAWLDRLLQDTEGRAIVGINLRPLRPDYTAGAPTTDVAAYTRFIEARFEERLAAAMRQFHKASRPEPCFVFFPMNAIQFGSSDLRSAYRLKRLLRGDVDFRVWEGDPSIDGVVALLRRVDAAITMRFHATIFAVSAERNVIGVDYRPGVRDKVAALLSDLGRGDRCGRIDEVTTAWLADRLTESAGRAAAPAGESPHHGGGGGSGLPPVQRPVAT